MDECAFLHADQLKLPSSDKHRSFSTSTPFLLQDYKLRTLSPNVCSSAENDSGLGASISEISAASIADITGPSLTVTVSSCQTPASSSDGPPFCGPRLDICVSPVSSRRQPTRRSLDLYSCERNGCLNSCTSTVSADDSSLCRSLNKGVSRKLDLDLNIYMNDEDSGTNFTAPYESRLASQFDKILQKYSPPVTDRLIGRKMGCEEVDILGELSFRNISCVSIILSYLDPQDLCRVCIVSKQWKSLCETDKKAHQRKRCLIRNHRDKQKRIGKENAGKRSALAPRGAERTALQNVSMVQQSVHIPCQDVVKTTTEQFMAAGASLKNDERLQKCPRCRKPAKVLPIQDRGMCQNPDCSYDFCIKCLCEFHGSKECTPIVNKKVKADSIGTRKSKKNLKRL